MKKFILVFSLLMIGMASFADSWFNIHSIEHRKWSMEEESTCVFLSNSKYIVCYEQKGIHKGCEDSILSGGPVRFKYLDETTTGGKTSVRSYFNIITFLKNNGIVDTRIWIIPRKGGNEWKLYSGENRIKF